MDSSATTLRHCTVGWLRKKPPHKQRASWRVGRRTSQVALTVEDPGPGCPAAFAQDSTLVLTQFFSCRAVLGRGTQGSTTQKCRRLVMAAGFSTCGSDEVAARSTSIRLERSDDGSRSDGTGGCRCSWRLVVLHSDCSSGCSTRSSAGATTTEAVRAGQVPPLVGSTLPRAAMRAARTLQGRHTACVVSSAFGIESLPGVVFVRFDGFVASSEEAAGVGSAWHKVLNLSHRDYIGARLAAFLEASELVRLSSTCYFSLLLSLMARENVTFFPVPRPLANGVRGACEDEEL